MLTDPRTSVYPEELYEAENTVRGVRAALRIPIAEDLRNLWENDILAVLNNVKPFVSNIKTHIYKK